LAGFDEFISSASWLAVMFIGGPVLKLLALHRHIGTMSQTLFLMNWNVLAMIAVSCPFLLAASRGFKWDSMIGELSYPIYLSHIFIYEVMAKFAPYSLVPSNFLYVCVTIAFSILLLWAVVLPVDRFRKNLARQHQFSGLVPIVTEAPAEFEKGAGRESTYGCRQVAVDVSVDAPNPDKERIAASIECCHDRQRRRLHDIHTSSGSRASIIVQYCC
jgi:peptidoglycan/LPS O-acetylase OafA/YrhL